MTQVDKNYYNLKEYSYLDRWSSYYYQLREIINLAPQSLLEIGLGDKVLSSYLKNNLKIIYKSLDFDPSLEPDIIASVAEMPLKDNSFDLIVAFQVLEHLPFSNFEKALAEIRRVSRKDAIISLPHFGPPLKFLLKLPLFKEIKLARKIRLPLKHNFNGQHYWEIGKHSYPLKKIKDIISQYFFIKKHFVPFENQYHHFFVLEKLK